MVREGIDVSQYQGQIDWELVKNHIDFAILLCGYGQDIPGQDDPTFKRNADECTRLGIPFGYICILMQQLKVKHCLKHDMLCDWLKDIRWNTQYI